MQAKPEKFGIQFSARRDGRTFYMTMYELFTGKRDRTHIHLQYGLGYRVVHDITLKLVGLSRHVYHDQFLTGVASPGRCWKILTPVVHQILTERRSIFNYDQRNSSWNDSFMCRRLKKRIKKDCLSITAWNYNNVVLVLHSDSSSDHVRCKRKKNRSASWSRCQRNCRLQ